MTRGRILLELRRARGPFFVLAVLVVCSVVVSGALIAKQTFQRPWEDYDEVRVAFEDVKGVVPGQQEVRVAGVKVGLIKSSTLTEGRPVLTLAVEDRYAPVYRNATFRLRPKTPLQDMYVEMSRGTPKAGEIDGDAIVPAAQTVTPVDVSRVLQSFDGDTRSRLTSLLHQFGGGVEDRGAQLRQGFVELAPFLTSADQLAGALAVRRSRLKRLVSSSSDLMGELGRRDQDLAGLVSLGNQTLGRLAREDKPLAETIAQLPGTMSDLRGSLTSLGRAQDQLDPALRELRPAARQLGSGLTALDKLSGDLQPAAKALTPAVDALQPLARTLPRTAAALGAAATRLRPLVPDLDLATRQLAACETPFARFFSWTLSVIKLRDGYSSFPRGNVSVGLDSVKNNTSGITGLSKALNCDVEVKP